VIKPQWVAVPLVAILALLLVGIWAGPLWVANLTLPLRLQTAQAVRSIADFGSWFKDIGQLRSDNEQLVKQRNQLLAQVADLQSAERENQAIKKQFHLHKSSDKTIKVAHSAGLSQQGNVSYLLIDQGRDQGVQVGQIVLSDGVLVGRIQQVDQHTSLVQLPISLGSTVPVVIRHGQAVIKGVVEGSFNLTARLTQVLPTDTLEPNEVIETSADGGVYPPGIVVGQVGAVTKKDSQVFQSASVNLLWDIRQLEIVFVAQ
jgi:rod shape-determining protein MreC